MQKIGKCQSCGDDKVRIRRYNNSESCDFCLSMDRRGVGREEILKEIEGKEKYGNQLRRNRPKNRKISSR
jgi:hypothetical protein